MLGGSIRRPVRFVMWYKIFEIPLLKFIFRTAKAIPIATRREDPELLERAYDRIDEELEDGNLVCLFPEGGITYAGTIPAFKPGIERIIERRAVPVIPISLGGLWGSWFSRRSNGRLRRLPGKLFARVDVRIGEPVAPSDVSAANSGGREFAADAFALKILINTKGIKVEALFDIGLKNIFYMV